MRVVVQRVKYAKVKVEGNIVGEIKKGFLVLLGVRQNDTTKEADYIVKKICNLRVFEDDKGKMNLSLKDINGKLLIVSQFTLYADCKNGNRPSFSDAANPKEAKELYEYVIDECKKNEVIVETGSFGSNMKIELLNDGPVTIIIEK